MIKIKDNTVIVSKNGLGNVSFPLDAAKQLNKTDFIKTYKSVLHGYTEDVYDELKKKSK